jgi:hypothetical protein
MLSVSGFAFCNRAGACSERCPRRTVVNLQNEANPDRFTFASMNSCRPTNRKLRDIASHL